MSGLWGEGGGGGVEGWGHLLSKWVGVCCQEPGIPTPFSDMTDTSFQTNIYPIVDKQYMLICSVS